MSMEKKNVLLCILKKMILETAISNIGMLNYGIELNWPDRV